MPVPLAQLNAFNQDQFVATLGGVFESSPWVAARAWQQRPFRSVDALHQAMCSTMYAAPVEQQIALIRAHPDLAGKAALAGDLTPESTREQASVGLDRLTPQELRTFTERNEAYQQRFGFPFIICVRKHTKHGILQSYVDRLGNTREQEITTALGEIAKIAHLRLNDLVEG
jgi:OHCU decarboxylase